MKSLARFFSPASFGCFAVLAVIPGCPPTEDPTVRLQITEVLRGNANQVLDEGPFGDPFDGGNAVTAFTFLRATNRGLFEEIEVVIGGFDGRSPQGVTLVRDLIGTDQASARFLIAEDAPPRPFFVSIKGSTTEGFFARSNSFPFYIHRPGMGPAPRITAVTKPEEIFRGTQATIAVTGVNFAGATIVMEDAAGIAVLAQSVDPNTSTLTATLDVKPDANTGFSTFYIETPAGGSLDHGLSIIEPRPLGISAIYPNYCVFGSTVEVTIAGDNFHTGMSVGSVPNTAITTGTLRFVDSHNVRLLVRPRTLDPDTPALAANGVGGSDSIFLRTELRGFKGPRLSRVTPQQIVAGTRDVQIEVEGVNFDTSAPTGFAALFNETVGEVFRPGDDGRVLPRTSPASQRVVLLAQPDAMARPGRFDLFIATADGLKSNVVPVDLIAPPADKPFAAHAQTGRIARDGVARPDTIIGERLTGVRRVTSNTPGLEVVSFTENPAGTSLDVMVRASAATPLTGDARTVFKAHTAQGESNEVGYLVEPAGALPGAPRLDRIFPNFVYPANNAQTFFTVTGAGFANLWDLLVTPPGSTNPDIFNFAENSSRGNALLISLEVFSPATANSLGITVTTQGGALVSNPLSIAVLDPANPTGPAILSVSPSTIDVQPDSVFQFRISGTNFGPAGPASMIRFARENDDPIRSVRLFSPTDPGAAQDSVVVQFDIGPAPDGDVTEFALEANGLVSALISISYSATPEGSEGQPFLSRTTGGQIRRGQTVMNETIRGTGLLNVTSVLFNAPGITVSSIVQSTDGGATFTGTFTAADDAVLTGDTVTSFYIETADGGRSNNSGYIVLP